MSQGHLNDLEWACAEMIAAYREHKAFMLVGGHVPTRVDEAVDNLENALSNKRNPVPLSKG